MIITALETEKIILFDGYCNLCSGLVQFLIRNDHKKRLKFSASQSETGKQLMKKYRLEDVNTSIYFIDGNKVYDRSQAVFHIASYLGFPYVMILIFGVFGRPINDGLYNIIARLRFKIFGKRSSCKIPDEKFESRFVH